MPCVEIYYFFLVVFYHVLLEYQSSERLGKFAKEVEAVTSTDGAELCEEVFVAEGVSFVGSASDDLHIDLAIDNIEFIFYCFDCCVFAHISFGFKPLNLYEQYR